MVRKGDIVVRTRANTSGNGLYSSFEGALVMAIEDSEHNRVTYKVGYLIPSDSWRFANQSEIDLFHKGVKNLGNIFDTNFKTYF